jgi:hypothetical protein
MSAARLPICLLLAVLGCRGGGGRTAACENDEQCVERLADSCPAGSATYAECRGGACALGGCSSPLGTPCDDDPGTYFEGDDDCPPRPCTSDEQCAEHLRSECPGGSVAHAECRDGHCELGGCSSPIGTPCDDDPSTVFEDEECGGP